MMGKNGWYIHIAIVMIKRRRSWRIYLWRGYGNPPQAISTNLLLTSKLEVRILVFMVQILFFSV